MNHIDISNDNISMKFAAFEIHKWRFRLEIDGQSYSFEDAELENSDKDRMGFKLNFRSIGVVWDFKCSEIEQQGRLIVESALYNNSGKDIALGSVHILDAVPCTDLGKPGTSTVHLGLEGVDYERPVFPIESNYCNRNSTIKSQFYSKSLDLAVQVGFTSFKKLDTRVTHSYAEETGITNICAYCDFQGWVLKSGQSTLLETFTLAVGNNPFRQLEDWADLAAEKCMARKWQENPIGYLGGSWVDTTNYENYEETVLRNAEAIRRKLSGFGFGYVWVSISNLFGGYPGDWLSWNSNSFPSGPHGFIKKLEEYGLKLGFWCAPFWICSILKDKVEEFADAFLHDLDGNILVARDEWEFGDSGRMPKAQRPVCYALDPTHPKVLEYLKKVFETYREWGIRYYMADFLECATGSIGRLPYRELHNKDVVAGQEAYHMALKVIREAAGDDTYILASTGPTVHNAGFADGIRTGTDFGEGRALTPDSYFYPGSYVINNSGFWTGALAALRNQASAYYTHRKLYINDSGNVLTVDKPLPVSDAQIHATIHAMSGGPSMVGDDIDRMDDERLGYIKKTLPRSKEVAFPIDLFDSPMPGYPRIYHRKIVKSWGEFDIAAVYNFDESVYEDRIDMARLGLDPDTIYHIWEFWDCKYIGPAKGDFNVLVPPGSVKVYRITADNGNPTVIGSDMHICMGEMELEECSYDPDAMSLSISATRPVGETGNLYVYIPKGYCVENPTGYWVTKDGRYDNLIVRAKFSFESAASSCHIDIKPIKSSLDLKKVEP